MITTKFKVGNVIYEMTFDNGDMKKALLDAIVLSNMPIDFSCQGDDKYKQENYRLMSNKDKEGNIYVRCKNIKTGRESKLGTYKAGGGYFWNNYEESFNKQSKA